MESTFCFPFVDNPGEWKGNDRLVRAFGRFVKSGGAEWRLILLEWGDDVDRTKDLLKELDLQSRVIWQGICSKPVLRKRQRAADVVCDQFVMEGYGSSVLELSAAGKPVVTSLLSQRMRLTNSPTYLLLSARKLRTRFSRHWSG